MLIRKQEQGFYIVLLLAKSCLDQAARFQQTLVPSVCHNQYIVLERYAALATSKLTKKETAPSTCARQRSDRQAYYIHNQRLNNQQKIRFSQRNQRKALIAVSFSWRSAHPKLTEWRSRCETHLHRARRVQTLKPPHLNFIFQLLWHENKSKK